VVDRGPTWPCPICGGVTAGAGSKRSSFSGGEFVLRRCQHCLFAFVSNPRLDYESIYDDNYYRGRGADPLVDYAYEHEHQDVTIRQFEWHGVWQVVAGLIPAGPETRWLDYGCGVGGLVSYLRQRGVHHAVGFEQGWNLPRLRQAGIPHLTAADLAQAAGTFDVVTAIEVIEHVVDPVKELAQMGALLRPGGLLFLTTGNAQPFRDRLTSWRYVVPDVHVSFFEPSTLALALEEAGLAPSFPGYITGWQDIIRFKVLKSLGCRRTNPLTHLVPWGLASRVVDRRLEVSAHPVGWAPASG
jgi:SAM-dependent methyltransferase